MILTCDTGSATCQEVGEHTSESPNTDPNIVPYQRILNAKKISIEEERQI